jgi:ribonuclease D
MSKAPTTPPILIEAQSDLQRLIEELCAEPAIAIDTESNSLFAYQERVCLIQFSIPGVDYLVDPLALQDLTSLGDVLASPKTVKVLHGAEYDVIVLKRDFGFQINNLFDTRMAIRTLGREDTSLQKLLETEFDVKLNKRFQRANWGKRPLKAELLNYARLDTHYLLTLYQRLDAALRDAGRIDEMTEACAYITRLQPPTNSFDPQGFWNINSARKLNPRQAAVLRELWAFRNRTARKRDVPVFKIVDDRVLLALAQAMPEGLSELGEVAGMTPGLQRRYGGGLLEAVKVGAKAPQAHPPRHKRTPDAVIERYDRLRQWRKKVAQRRGLSSDIVMPRDALWKIAHHRPNSQQELRKLILPLAWRAETYGKEILALLDG